MEINVYCDGGSRGNGSIKSKSAWGFVVYNSDNKEIYTDSKGEIGKSNNQMELTALLEALKVCLKVAKGKPLDKVKYNLDSKYVLQGLQDWMPNWKKNNWRTAAKKPVKNQELWIEIDSLYQELKQHTTVEFAHVYGHTGNFGNERADELCNICMDMLV